MKKIYPVDDLDTTCAICKKSFGDHFSTWAGKDKNEYHCPKEDGSKNMSVGERTYFKSASCN